MQKIKDTGEWQYIYSNKLDKPCFQHDMAYGDFKDLATRTTSDKIKHLILLKIQNMIDINVELLQSSIKFLIKRFW